MKTARKKVVQWVGKKGGSKSKKQRSSEAAEEMVDLLATEKGGEV